MAVTWKNVLYGLGLLSLCFVGIPVRINDDLEQQFQEFLRQHNKSYVNNPSEMARRFDIFKRSLERAANYNALHDDDDVQFGVTKFSDLEAEEFEAMLLKHQPSPASCVLKLNSLSSRKARRKRQIFKEGDTLPDHVDWRDKHIISPVKNQLSCGACWAFSTVETIESMYALSTGMLKQISTQQVIDCARNGNKGCVGGDTCTALSWMVSSNVSLLEEKQYPLTLASEKCRAPPEGAKGIHLASNYTCYNLAENEELFKRLLAFHGPVTAAVDAVTWQDYLGGIIQYHCQDRINHAVQVVGYDTRGPIPYYIVRNSWGADFGIQGYLKIAIGSNLCGIAREVSALNVVLP